MLSKIKMSFNLTLIGKKIQKCTFAVERIKKNNWFCSYRVCVVNNSFIHR